MEIEQLKLILETIKTVSGDAQIVAVTWLIVQGVLPALISLIAIIFAYKAAMFLATCFVQNKNNSDALEGFYQILYGRSVPCGFFTDVDLFRMRADIIKLKQNYDLSPPSPPPPPGATDEVRAKFNKIQGG